MNRSPLVAALCRRSKFQRFLLVLGGGWTAIQPVAAQRVTFYPAVGIEGTRASNVGYVGTTAGRGEADWIKRLGLSLALRREGRGVQAGLQYGGFLERFSKFSVLNHEEHSLSLNLASPPAKRSAIAFDAAYSRGQTQGNPGSLQAADLFLTERTNRQALRGTLRYDRQGGGRWSFGASGSGSRTWFGRISGLPETSPEAAPEDRREYGANVTVQRSLSPRAGIGWVYGFTRFDLQESGREDVHTLAMTFSRSVGRNGAVSFQIGAFDRSGSTLEGEPRAVDRGLQARTGMGMSWTGRNVSFGINADRNASSGGALKGTSTDTTVGVTVGNVRPVRWSWTTAARYALRQPTDPLDKRVQSVAAGFGLERRWGETLALRAAVNRVRQYGGDTALEGNATDGTVGLSWSPRGRGIGTK